MISFQMGKIPHCLHLFALFLSRITESLSKSPPCPPVFALAWHTTLDPRGHPPLWSLCHLLAASSGGPMGAGPSWTAWGFLVSPDSFMVRKEREAGRTFQFGPSAPYFFLCVADCSQPRRSSVLGGVPSLAISLFFR